ncbi:MAG: hypothetical protein JXB47_03090 [Anaerolineae bacterium]|nr:hypothetical protein [Anaerolineae bacterium]
MTGQVTNAAPAPLRRAEHEQALIDNVRRQLEARAANFELVREEFVRDAQANPAGAVEWRAIGVIEAQATMELAQQTLKWIARATGDDPETIQKFYGDAAPPAREIERVLAGLERARAEQIGKVLRAEFFPRCTCPATNLVNVVKAKAAADFTGEYSQLNGLIDYLKAHLAECAGEAVA